MKGIVAALMLLAAPAEAALVTKAMLIRACTARTEAQVNDCAGYIAGIADVSDAVRRGVCIPEGTDLRAVRRRVTQWLQAHTVDNGPAAPAVMGALRTLYPCPGL